MAAPAPAAAAPAPAPAAPAPAPTAAPAAPVARTLDEVAAADPDVGDGPDAGAGCWRDVEAPGGRRPDLAAPGEPLLPCGPASARGRAPSGTRSATELAMIAPPPLEASAPTMGVTKRISAGSATMANARTTSPVYVVSTALPSVLGAAPLMWNPAA